MNPLRQKAKDIYRQTALESWLIGVLTGLLITGLVALNILVPASIFIVFPLVCLPLLFAAHMSHLQLKSGQQITFGNNMKNYAGFFHRPYNSTFSFLMSLLKAVGVFFVIELTMSFIGQPITMIFNSGINDSIETLNNLLGSEGVTLNDIYDVFYMNNYALLIYFCIVILPAFALAFIAFIFFISRSSTSLYLRIRFPNANPQMLKYVQTYFFAMNRGRTLKDYWSLNWPMYVLLLLGAIGGAIGFSFISKDPIKLVGATLTGSLLLTIPFLPFYLCNMEAIGESYREDYDITINKINEAAVRNMEARMQQEKELQAKMEEMMNQVKQENQENQDTNNEAPKEDNEHHE